MDSKILDASAFYAGVPFGADDDWQTTPLILDEVSHIKKRQDVMAIMIETGRLKIKEPAAESTAKATGAAGRTGDLRQLSRQDISVLALAIETSGQIVTDDFAVSNVARFLKIVVIPVMTGGIRNSGVWIHYCSGCRRNFKNVKKCPLCGNNTRRKLVKG